MCKIIITYRCGCKPYETKTPCKKPDCQSVKEIVQEPRCEQCQGQDAEMELALKSM